MKLAFQSSHDLRELALEGASSDPSPLKIMELLPEISEAEDRFIAEYRGRPVLKGRAGTVTVTLAFAHQKSTSGPNHRLGPFRTDRGFAAILPLWREDLYHTSAGLERAASDVFATLEERLDAIIDQLENQPER